MTQNIIPLQEAEAMACSAMLEQFLQQKGDKGAKLLQTLQRYIRYCHYKMYSLNHADQQEVLQEVVLKLFQIQTIPTGNCTGWLFTIVRNEYIDYLRCHNRQGRVFVPDDSGNLQEIQTLDASVAGLPVSSDENVYVEADCLERVFDHIAAQPTGAEDMELYTQYAMGHAHEDIAAQTGRSVGAIAKRLSVLRERVRALREQLC